MTIIVIIVIIMTIVIIIIGQKLPKQVSHGYRSQGSNSRMPISR